MVNAVLQNDAAIAKTPEIAIFWEAVLLRKWTPKQRVICNYESTRVNCML